MENTKRCPFCYKLPNFEFKNGYWQGGCISNLNPGCTVLADVILQPSPESAMAQWNYVVELFDGVAA